jgi:hypothetical protein
MGTNTSTLQLQKRQFPTVYCGSKVKLRRADKRLGATRTCTLGFAVKKTRGRGGGFFEHGYLTLGDCFVVSNAFRILHVVIHGPQNLLIGDAINSQANLKYDPLEGLDYAIIKITEGQV